MTKPLAPFGHYLAKQIMEDAGNHIAIIFMGNHAWQRATDFQKLLPFTLCLPPNESPWRYDWKLSGCEVYLVDTGKSWNSFIRECAKCFLTSGAASVRYISRNTRQTFKRRST